MKVRILYAGRYLDLSTPPVHRARRHEVGDVVEFPADYAEGIIACGLAEPFSEPDVTGDVEVELEPEAKPVNATEGAKTLARELGIDLATVQGSGAGGRITMRDVEYLE